MRVAAKRRQAGWVTAAQLLEGTQRPVRLDQGEWVDVVQLGNGDPLVLVPGLAGGWRLVAPLALRLAQRFEVTICGLRGDRFPVGGAGPREIGDYAHDLSEVMGRLRLERPAVLGISFGGAIALELACEQPQKVGALIVHGAGARFRTTLASTVARRVLERFPLPTDNRFVNQFFNLLHGGTPEPGPTAEFVVDRCWETDQSVMARRLALLESYDVSERLWRIDAPTLVVAGSRDVVVSPAEQKALAGLIPGARFETLDGAGHVGFLTHRRDFALAAARHLRQVKHQAC
jgi:pimeloyl-ACP methyl ester carboxylesterase